jgi:hypothetical protein
MLKSKKDKQAFLGKKNYKIIVPLQRIKNQL